MSTTEFPPWVTVQPGQPARIKTEWDESQGGFWRATPYNLSGQELRRDNGTSMESTGVNELDVIGSVIAEFLVVGVEWIYIESRSPVRLMIAWTPSQEGYSPARSSVQ